MGGRRCLLLIKPVMQLFLMMILVILIVAGCDSDSNLPIYGEYTMDDLIYHSSLNSVSFERWKEQMGNAEFTIRENEFRINTPEFNYEITKPTYQTRKMDEKYIDCFQQATSDMIAIADYKYKYQYEVLDQKQRTIYRLYLMDDELWLASYIVSGTGDETILDLMRLK